MTARSDDSMLVQFSKPPPVWPKQKPFATSPLSCRILAQHTLQATAPERFIDLAAPRGFAPARAATAPNLGGAVPLPTSRRDKPSGPRQLPDDGAPRTIRPPLHDAP